MKQLDFSRIKRFSIANRKSKVNIDNFAKVYKPGARFSEFTKNLPKILKTEQLEQFCARVVSTWKNKKTLIIGSGAHTIKCGLSPLFIDLMRRGLVHCIALNGAGIVHDFEIAFCGATSEDVQSGLLDGTFGMAEETGKLINDAIRQGAEKNLGLGESVGKKIAELDLPNKEFSILYSGVKYNVPVTVHVAIGTDIIHQHPEASGEAIGKTSYADFETLAFVISRLEGGVFINFGSAVIIPEVFLKALTVARNLGFGVKELTTANFDMIQHYRPIENIVKRPTFKNGYGYNFTGHHEIMIPLLFAMLNEMWNKK